MIHFIKVKLSSGVRSDSLTSSIQFRWFLPCLVGGGVSTVVVNAQNLWGFLWYHQTHQVVADDSSARAPSLEASTAAPLTFSSNSGVLGGADFRAGLPAVSR